MVYILMIMLRHGSYPWCAIWGLCWCIFIYFLGGGGGGGAIMRMIQKTCDGLNAADHAAGDADGVAPHGEAHAQHALLKVRHLLAELHHLAAKGHPFRTQNKGIGMSEAFAKDDQAQKVWGNAATIQNRRCAEKWRGWVGAQSTFPTWLGVTMDGPKAASLTSLLGHARKNLNKKEHMVQTYSQHVAACSLILQPAQHQRATQLQPVEHAESSTPI